MARKSKKEKDKIRARKARARKNRRDALKPGPQQAVQDSRLSRFLTACNFWTLGEYERAAGIFRELLESGDDRYFARYWWASCLFQLESFDALDELLQEYDDGSGIWRFAQALHAFRREGDTDEARRMLVEADHREPGFEQYLLQDKVVDASREVWFDAAEAERASGCARLFLPAWRSVPGAVSWARRVLKVPPTGANSDNVSRRFPRDELLSLPLRRETWQVGLMQQDDPSHEDDSPMWLLGVANLDRQEMRVVTLIDQKLTETLVWNVVIQAFQKPMEGDAARPSVLVVGRGDFHDAWKPLLAEIGIDCQHEDDPQPVGQLLEAMAEAIRKPELPDAGDINIREFSQSDAVWQADFVRSPAWVMNEQEGSYRPWSVLVLDKSRSYALMIEHTPADPTPEMLWDFLVRTMAAPRGTSAQRPRVVEFSDSDCYDHIRPRLEEARVACRLVDELTEFNDFCLRLAKSFDDGSDKCALADGQGVTRAQMESFYEAAEYYFKQAPWRRVPGEVPIEIRSVDPAMGTRYAIVLGRTGVQLGLCIYDDWKTTVEALRGYGTPGESSALAVCYDEAEIMAAVDLQLVERLGWPIATQEAWPAVMRLQPSRTPRSPTADELLFLDACLRAIPDFVKTAAAQTVQVETGTRPVELQLAWKDF